MAERYTLPFNNETNFRPSYSLLFSFPESPDSPLLLTERYLLKRIQYFRSQILFYYSVFFTAITSIEVIFPLPLILFCLGADYAASIVLFYALVLIFGTQIFKRFVWRARPWMVDSSILVWKKDKTSSFPSRGVVCSIVFCFALADSLHWEHPMWLSALLVYVSTSTALSRLYLGAHFFSDTVFGHILGFILVELSRKMQTWCWPMLGCDILTSSETCYGEATVSVVIREKYSSLLIAIAVLYLVVILLSVNPVLFWTKSAVALGLLFPCLVYRGIFLCNPNQIATHSLQAMSKWNGLLVIGAVVVPIGLLSLGWFTMKKKWSWLRNLLIYTILFTSSSILLVLCSLQRSSN
eukprot:jgi/Galph1/4976/GphlegSOOS_G3663.1